MKHHSQLLAAGASVDQADKYGITPLIRSSRRGYTDVVKQVCVVSPIFTNKPSNTTAQAHQLGK